MDVATVVGLFAAGETAETVSSEHALSVEQIRAALAYAADGVERQEGSGNGGA